MKISSRFAVMAATGALIISGAAAWTAVPASAAGGHVGVCDSSESNSWCWYVKSSNGGLAGDTRDITYSPNQDLTVIYDGTVTSTGCYTGAPGGTGVYSFYSSEDGGGYIGAGYTSDGGVQYYAGLQSGENQYSNWVWQSNGTLLNCGDNFANQSCSEAGHNYSIPDADFNGSLIYTECLSVGAAWDQYDPPFAVGNYFIPRGSNVVNLQPHV